jgi:hypothetical protein
MRPHEDGEFLDRLWGDVHVNPTTQCWEHINGKHGYAKLSYKNKPYTAHRVALEIKFGRPIAPGLVARHSCHTRRCINPQHLSEGTQAENNQDMIDAGRTVHFNGEMGAGSVLTDDKVQIARWLRHFGMTGAEIGERLGVAPRTISDIKTGKCWHHLPKPNFVTDPAPDEVLDAIPNLRIKLHRRGM